MDLIPEVGLKNLCLKFVLEQHETLPIPSVFGCHTKRKKKISLIKMDHFQ